MLFRQEFLIRDCCRDLDACSGSFRVASDGRSWANGGWELGELPRFNAAHSSSRQVLSAFLATVAVSGDGERFELVE